MQQTSHNKVHAHVVGGLLHAYVIEDLVSPLYHLFWVGKLMREDWGEIVLLITVKARLSQEITCVLNYCFYHLLSQGLGYWARIGSSKAQSLRGKLDSSLQWRISKWFGLILKFTTLGPIYGLIGMPKFFRESLGWDWFSEKCHWWCAIVGSLCVKRVKDSIFNRMVCRLKILIYFKIRTYFLYFTYLVFKTLNIKIFILH